MKNNIILKHYFMNYNYIIFNFIILLLIIEYYICFTFIYRKKKLFFAK